jgi:alginate O-acetyltransferase complex protein AlgI
MASRAGDSIRSYPNIARIRDSQKQAALEAGVAFWDSYEAMGGKSSIVKWAEKEPPLAQKDYVHFTYPGADSISQLLIKALFSIQTGDSVNQNELLLEVDSSTMQHPAKEIKRSNKSMNNGIMNILLKDIFTYNPDKPFIFTTPAFWIFFLFILAGYCLLYRKLFIRNIYLFIVSLFFYFKSGGLFLFLLIFVTIIDYACGLLIYHSKTRIFRKLFILLSIISNLGLLVYFKYAGFFITAINNFFGTDFKVYDLLSAFSNSSLGTSFDISNIILPVGISFFTFQSLSYTIDVYRRKMEPVRDILNFGFYVSFFPHLVAGPIVRASVFIPQLYQEFRLIPREFSHALYMISKGLIKKIIISNFIAVNFIDRVFDAPSLYSGFENLIAVYGYGLQIYCDFSGYTDIAIGVALILGFRLPVNFNSPYKATSITDFWKRWHISLSQWLKDYLYISLGGNRKGKVRTYFNLMITMVLGGLWHGAAIKFVIWGALHGIGLVVHKIWGFVFVNRLRSNRFVRLISIFVTFQFVSFCWIFFRAGDMDNVMIILRQMTQNFSPGSYLNVVASYSNVFLIMAIGYLIHFLPERTKESYRGVFIRIPLIAQLASVMLMAILLYQMRTTEILPFIYFRF